MGDRGEGLRDRSDSKDGVLGDRRVRPPDRSNLEQSLRPGVTRCLSFCLSTAPTAERRCRTSVDLLWSRASEDRSPGPPDKAEVSGSSPLRPIHLARSNTHSPISGTHGECLTVRQRRWLIPGQPRPEQMGAQWGGLRSSRVVMVDRPSQQVGLGHRKLCSVCCG
jgi:hypothetical protein